MTLTLERFREKQINYFNSEYAVEPALCFSDSHYDEILGYEIPGEERCVYKTQEGRKCAIGAVIPDKLYNPQWDSDVDGVGVSGLEENVQIYLRETGLYMDTLGDLQNFHDQLAKDWYHDIDGLQLNNPHFGKLYLERARSKFPSIFVDV